MEFIQEIIRTDYSTEEQILRERFNLGEDFPVSDSSKHAIHTIISSIDQKGKDFLYPNRMELYAILLLGELSETPNKIIDIYNQVTNRISNTLTRREYKKILKILSTLGLDYKNMYPELVAVGKSKYMATSKFPFFYDEVAEPNSLWGKFKESLTHRSPTPHYQSRSAAKIALKDPLRSALIILTEGLPTRQTIRTNQGNFHIFNVPEITLGVLKEVRKYSTNLTMTREDVLKSSRVLKKYAGLFDHVLVSGCTRETTQELVGVF